MCPTNASFLFLSLDSHSTVWERSDIRIGRSLQHSLAQWGAAAEIRRRASGWWICAISSQLPGTWCLWCCACGWCPESQRKYWAALEPRKEPRTSRTGDDCLRCIFWKTHLGTPANWRGTRIGERSRLSGFCCSSGLIYAFHIAILFVITNRSVGHQCLKFK